MRSIVCLLVILSTIMPLILLSAAEESNKTDYQVVHVNELRRNRGLCLFFDISLEKGGCSVFNSDIWLVIKSFFLDNLKKPVIVYALYPGCAFASPPLKCKRDDGTVKQVVAFNFPITEMCGGILPFSKALQVLRDSKAPSYFSVTNDPLQKVEKFLVFEDGKNACIQPTEFNSLPDELKTFFASRAFEAGRRE